MVLMKPSIPSSLNTGQKYTVMTRCMGQNEKSMFAHDLQQVNWTPLYQMDKCVDQFSFFYSLHIRETFPLKGGGEA